MDAMGKILSYFLRLKMLLFQPFVGGIVAITFMLINEKTTIATALGILFSICLLLGTIYSAIHRLHLLKIMPSKKGILWEVVLQKKRVYKGRFVLLGYVYWSLWFGSLCFGSNVCYVLSS